MIEQFLIFNEIMITSTHYEYQLIIGLFICSLLIIKFLFFQVRTSKLYATVNRCLVWISLTFKYTHTFKDPCVCSYIHCKEEKLLGLFRNAWSHVVLASSITFLDPFLDIALCPLTCPILALSMWDKNKVYPLLQWFISSKKIK